jgi:galactokinase
LQNAFSSSKTRQQDIPIALALCEKLLSGKGAYRIHGGGFAGTIQAFVPVDMLDEFKYGIEKTLGKEKCYVLSIRQDGGISF